MQTHRHNLSSTYNRSKDLNTQLRNIHVKLGTFNKKNNRSFVIKVKQQKEKINLIKNLFKRAKYKLYEKYNCLNEKYESIIVKHLLNNENTHLVSVFKDYMIFDYKEEFLRRYYSLYECSQRIPEFSIYYHNYLLFFCKPIISDLKLNDILLDYEEKKAEIYYKKNCVNGKEDLDFFETNNYSKIDFSNDTIFKNSIKESIDKAKLTSENNTNINIEKNTNNNSINNTIILTLETLRNELINNKKEQSEDNTLSEIINGFYSKRIKKVVNRRQYNNKYLMRESKKNSSKALLNKISREKIENYFKKGVFSNSNINNHFSKPKPKRLSSPIINNYKYKPKTKTISRNKNSILHKTNSLSKAKTTLTASKSLIKSPTITKSRNLRNGLSSLSKGNTNTNITNKTHTICKSTTTFNISHSKQNINLVKTQNVDKIIKKYHLSNSNNGNNSISKKSYYAEVSCCNYNKPVSKIQKFKKTVPKLNKNNSKNKINSELGNMGFSLLVDGNSTLKKGVHYTNSNININTSNYMNINYKNTLNLRDGSNSKLKNNENIILNSKNNLKKSSRNGNLNNNSNISRTNDKIISSYNNKSVKNFNTLLKSKKNSFLLQKSKSKGKDLKI